MMLLGMQVVIAQYITKSGAQCTEKYNIRIVALCWTLHLRYSKRQLFHLLAWTVLAKCSRWQTEDSKGKDFSRVLGSHDSYMHIYERLLVRSGRRLRMAALAQVKGARGGRLPCRKRSSTSTCAERRSCQVAHLASEINQWLQRDTQTNTQLGDPGVYLDVGCCKGTWSLTAEGVAA